MVESSHECYVGHCPLFRQDVSEVDSTYLIGDEDIDILLKLFLF